MKKALLVLLPIVLFIACRKKSTSDRHVWNCIKNDSLVSNIPALNNSHVKDTVSNYDDVSEATIKFLMNQYTRMDTLYNKNDTLEREFWTMNCTRVDF
jgi:hypothetical protein